MPAPVRLTSLLLLALSGYLLLQSADDDAFGQGTDRAARETSVESVHNTVTASDNAIRIRVDRIPPSRLIALAAWHNPWKRVYLQSDPEKTPLKFSAGVQQWEISLPPSAEAGSTIVIETVGRPTRSLTSPIEPADDGSLILPAHLATVHGKMLRYEPQPHKNTVGYWVNQHDWCQWQIKVPAPGTYRVVVLQGCGKGQGGSRVAIRVGEQELTFDVKDTGHFQNFQRRNVGTLTIDRAGEWTLDVVPVSKRKGAVMDLREIRLLPRKGPAKK